MYFDFFTIAALLLAGLLFAYANIAVFSLFRPNKPNAEKLSTYECGEKAIGSSWVRFDMRFYTVALIFVVFDVELAFLFPWAVVFKEMGGVALIEGVIFITILFLGLVYVWAKGDLDWVKSFTAHKEAVEKKLAAQTGPAQKPAA
jgi:NADH-quinone oxidoreductase subunit A